MALTRLGLNQAINLATSYLLNKLFSNTAPLNFSNAQTSKIVSIQPSSHCIRRP